MALYLHSKMIERQIAHEQQLKEKSADFETLVKDAVRDKDTQVA